MESPNHYELLCVTREATPDEIRASYRRLVRIYHPDVAGAAGEAMTLRLNAAQRELLDPTLRARYDRTHFDYAGAGSTAGYGARGSHSSGSSTSGTSGRANPDPRGAQRDGQQARDRSDAWTPRQRPGAPYEQSRGAGRPSRPGFGDTSGGRRTSARARASRRPEIWSERRYLAWMSATTASIGIIVIVTAIVFAYCYSGGFSLMSPRLIPAFTVAFAWLVAAMSRPPKLLIALTVIGAMLWPLAELGVPPFSALSSFVPSVILALLTLVVGAVVVLRISAPRTVAIGRVRPAARS